MKWTTDPLRKSTMFRLGLGWSVLMACSSHACGPDFPNSIFDGTDAQILSTPVANFAVEVRRLEVPMPAFSAKPSEAGQHAADSRAAELADLKQALSLQGISKIEADAIVAALAAERDRLVDYVAAQQNWQKNFAWISNNAVPPPPMPNVRMVDGLPPEFSEYFRGAIAWHAGDTNGARTAWTAVLELPAAQRRFKSIWAAYMLGRSWEGSKPGRARNYYRTVRTLVDEGAMDTDGLAAASLGREALTYYRAGDMDAAIQLYLQQAAAGDPDAVLSLHFAAAQALWKHPGSLKSLARDPLSRRVITAYLVANVYPRPPVHLDGAVREKVINTLARIKYLSRVAPKWHRYEQATLLWLDAVERANIKSAEDAALLALAAYQAGEFEVATRWLEKAAPGTLSLWLHTRLALRDGQLDQAAANLTEIVEMMRQETAGQSLDEPGEPHQQFAFRSTLDQNEALAELGALRVVQGDFVEALDSLLQAGFWMDAAYVAERVLTVEELKAYVDQNWPEPVTDDPDASFNRWQPLNTNQRQGSAIRYLLARRLARLGRLEEARPYFPTEICPMLDEWRAALAQGRDLNATQPDRAAALWSAAQMLRTNGLELVGTAVNPDWAVENGDFDLGSLIENRTNSTVLPPSVNELERVELHVVTPEKRWHYQYLAAETAWEAAELMPDNTEETALVLYTAGSWLMYRDPKAADRFYKALVNRCGKIPLGQAADQKRWFPKLKEVQKLEN